MSHLYRRQENMGWNIIPALSIDKIQDRKQIENHVKYIMKPRHKSALWTDLVVFALNRSDMKGGLFMLMG